MATLVMTVVGTAATVIATVVTVLQLRRTQGLRRLEHRVRGGGGTVRVAVGTVRAGSPIPALPGQGGAIAAIPGTRATTTVQPVVLLPPLSHRSTNAPRSCIHPDWGLGE